MKMTDRQSKPTSVVAETAPLQYIAAKASRERRLVLVSEIGAQRKAISEILLRHVDAYQPRRDSEERQVRVSD